MKAVKGNIQLAAEGRQLEQAGRLEDAATAYQKVVDTDPGNKAVVNRLVIVYRRLKDYGKELSVIDTALGLVADRNKASQDKWLLAHPDAAEVGKAFLRTLGGQSVTAYGTDPLVVKLLKRKVVVEKKMGGKTAGRGKGTRASAAKKAGRTAKAKQGVSLKQKDTGVPKKELTSAGNIAAEKKQKEEIAAIKKKMAAAKKKRDEAAAKKKGELAARKKDVEKRKATAAARKAEQREAAAEKKAAERAAAATRKEEVEVAADLSLFVVSLRYLVPLERIDQVMARHVAFLHKHFATGTFLVSGRQIPRKGGIILARGKDKGAVERVMRGDPFVTGKLASMDIVEFKASQMGKGLEGWLRDGRTRRQRGSGSI